MPNDNDLYQGFGRVEGKVDSILTLLAGLAARVDALELRVGVLEKWQAYVIGAGTVIGAGLALAWQAIFGAP